MSANRNTPALNEWELLRRLYQCNKSQLAKRMGVSPQTLRRFEAATAQGEPLNNHARRAVAELLRAALRIANNADDLLKDRVNPK